jgi:hypothetical protein
VSPGSHGSPKNSCGPVDTERFVRRIDVCVPALELSDYFMDSVQLRDVCWP